MHAKRAILTGLVSLAIYNRDYNLYSLILIV